MTGPAPSAVILGTAQDGGYPQTGCKRPCCAPDRVTRLGARLPASMGLTDPRESKHFVIDATWALPAQLRLLEQCGGGHLAGILLTHAHMGHYTGLVHLGQEAMASQDLPVYVMARMATFLQSHEPWASLVRLGHIRLEILAPDVTTFLTPDIQIEPILVPHRDELSETVAYLIRGPSRAALHLPDIDAWAELPGGLERLLARVDAAWLDGTFFSGDELPGRDIAAIAHPHIHHTVDLLSSLPKTERRKVRFTHLNHTNPVLDGDSAQAEIVRSAGMQIAAPGEVFPL